jgi:putative membrane protein
MNWYLIAKSLHIIFIVTWFSGLFYMFRLFVYTAEAASKPEPDRSVLIPQLALMQRRLWYIITWPSCVLTLILGPYLLIQMPGFLAQPWMHVKLFFIVLLIIYQFAGQKIYTAQKINPAAYRSFFLRLMNEVGTLILVAVVFLVVMRDSVSWVWGSLGLIGTGVLISVFAMLYKKWRMKKGQ